MCSNIFHIKNSLLDFQNGLEKYNTYINNTERVDKSDSMGFISITFDKEFDFCNENIDRTFTILEKYDLVSIQLKNIPFNENEFILKRIYKFCKNCMILHLFLTFRTYVLSLFENFISNLYNQFYDIDTLYRVNITMCEINRTTLYLFLQNINERTKFHLRNQEIILNDNERFISIYNEYPNYPNINKILKLRRELYLKCEQKYNKCNVLGTGFCLGGFQSLLYTKHITPNIFYLISSFI